MSDTATLTGAPSRHEQRVVDIESQVTEFAKQAKAQGADPAEVAQAIESARASFEANEQVKVFYEENFPTPALEVMLAKPEFGTVTAMVKVTLYQGVLASAERNSGEVRAAAVVLLDRMWISQKMPGLPEEQQVRWIRTELEPSWGPVRICVHGEDADGHDVFRDYGTADVEQVEERSVEDVRGYMTPEPYLPRLPSPMVAVPGSAPEAEEPGRGAYL